MMGKRVVKNRNIEDASERQHGQVPQELVVSSKRGKILENEMHSLESSRRLMGRTDLVPALSGCIGMGSLVY